MSGVYYCKGCITNYTVYSTDEKFDKEILKPATRMLGVLYFLLAVTFFSVAIIFLHNVKKYHKDFYI